MKCNKCNQIIPDDSVFCHICGNKIPDEPAYAESVRTKKDKRPMSKKAKKAILLTAIFALWLAIISITVFLLIIPLVKYNHAQELLEIGKYDLAYTAFAELDDYGDSKNKLAETRYLQAVDYRKNGEYDVANLIFESLGDYRDSKALIHIHNYIISDAIEPTCTSKGRKTIVCTGCGESKVEIIDAKEHDYVIEKHKDATCLSPGEKQYLCSCCGDSYIKTIVPTPHNWENATCLAPKTCAICGKTEGNALGHSNGTVCTRCGVTTFTTLTYSGTGSKVIDYSIPKGKFKITVTMTSGEGSVDVKVHYAGLYGDTFEWFFITNSGNSEVGYINGATSGTIVVNASSGILGNSGWIVTIEASGN